MRLTLRAGWLFASLCMTVTPLDRAATQGVDTGFSNAAAIGRALREGHLVHPTRILRQIGRRASAYEIAAVADTLTSFALRWEVGRGSDAAASRRQLGSVLAALVSAGATHGDGMPFRPATQRLIAIADGARSLEVSSTVIGFLPMMADQDGVLPAIRRLAMKDDVRAVAAVNTLAGNRAGKLGDAGWVALRQLYDHDQVVFWQARQELDAIAVNLKGWPAKPAFRTPDAPLLER